MRQKSAVRNNDYYLAVLKRDFPQHHQDLLDGKYKSAAAAFKAAGIKKPRTRLQELVNAWGKATLAEQDAFLRHAGAIRAASPPHATSGPIASGRRLEPWAKGRIQEIMDRRGLESGDVMDEIGSGRLNPSFGRALHRGDRLQQSMIDALALWIADNASI